MWLVTEKILSQQKIYTNTMMDLKIIHLNKYIVQKVTYRVSVITRQKLYAH